MQLTRKRIITLMLTLLLGMTLIACKNETTTTTEVAPGDLLIPQLTSPDAVFFSYEDFDITYRDLYNGVKVNDGLNQLLAMVDLDLLNDYYQSVTQEEIDVKKQKLMYGTNDQDIIDKFTEDKLEEYSLRFEESMYLMGYDDNIDDYVRLVVMRENYVKDIITDEASSDQTWYVGPSQIADYYQNTFRPDVKSIKIKFISEADAKAVMREFNLVSRAGDLMLYTGEKPLDQVPSSQLNAENTRSLTEEEILGYYIDMYNYVYQDFRSLIDKNMDVLDLLELEDLSVAYDDLKTANQSLANFVYYTLGNREDFLSGESDELYYTYAPVKYFSNRDTSYYMILNLQGFEKADVDGFEGEEADLVALIGQEKYDEIEKEMIDTNLSSESFVRRRIAELRNEHDFLIYDYYLSVDYSAVDQNYAEDEEGSLTVLASYDDKTITPDDLLEYALNQNASLYLIYASQIKAIKNAHFEDVYCQNTNQCVYDFRDNESAKMLEHINDFESLKEQFMNSMYADFYEFEDYLYLAYGVKTEEEMINNYYVKATLQPLYIFDMIKENDYEVLSTILELMQPYFDNYFSLNVRHLLIYLDRNEDGSPDDFEDFYSDLEDKASFDEKLSSFEENIREYLNANTDNSFTTLVNEYKAAKRNDETWGEFKRYGFFIMTENLSSSASLTYSSSVNKFEDSFVDGLIDLYQSYILDDFKDESYLYSETLIETTYGMHLIRAEKGKDFERPTAVFEMTFDEDEEPEFTLGLESDAEIINLEQLKIYAQYRFSVISFGTINLSELHGFTRPTIPASLTKAFDAYIASLHDALYVVGFLNSGIISQIQAGELVNEVSNYCNLTEEQLSVKMIRLNEIYLRQMFADLDLR